MTDRMLIRIARATVACGWLLAATGLVIAVDTRNLGFWWRSFGALEAFLAASLGYFVWLAIARQPRNAAVWSMVLAVGLAVDAAALGFVGVLFDGDPTSMLEPDWVPAQAPDAVGWLLLPSSAASVIGLFVPLTFGLLLFPGGQLSTWRSRALALLAGIDVLVLAATYAWWHHPNNATDTDPILGASLYGLAAATGGAVLDLGLRFRHSTGTTRLQFKWVLSGTFFSSLAFVSIGLLPDAVAANNLTPLITIAAAASWVAAYGVALGRYRLYDIDAIISRSFVYLTLAVMISAVYVIVVVGIGSLLGGSGVWLWVLTTVFLAVAFEPVRHRLNYWASRLVYGREATPYEVLATLATTLPRSDSAEQLLTRAAEGLRSGTGARRTAAWLTDGPDGEAPRLVAVSPTATSGGHSDEPGGIFGTTVIIEHDGRPLGALSMEPPPGGNIRPADVRLAEDIAAAAALVLHKLQLDADLRARIADIDESRRRLVHAHDDELRRLERELERTIEPHVAALETEVRRVRAVATSEGADRTASVLVSFDAEARAAIEQIHSLAQGIYSSVLDRDGLAAAIPALAERGPFPVSPTIEVTARHPAALERAVYFCVSEALTNAAKHGRGPVGVDVRDSGGTLTFIVRDAGPGFAVAAATPGSGLHNMADRLESVGGSLTVDSRPGSATTITGAIPIPSPAPSTPVTSPATTSR